MNELWSRDMCSREREREEMGRLTSFRKGAWTEEEDMLLRRCVEMYGEGKWRHIPERAGLNRCRKSCRLRWLNYLRPNIKRGEFAFDEVDLIIRLHRLLGNRWSLIAGRIPGRTANDVKNYWNSHLSKKLILEHKIPSSLTNQLIKPHASAKTGEWSRSISESSGDHRQEEEGSGGEEEEEGTTSFWKSLLVQGEEMKTNFTVENKAMAMEDEDLFVGFEDLLHDMELTGVFG